MTHSALILAMFALSAGAEPSSGPATRPSPEAPALRVGLVCLSAAGWARDPNAQEHSAGFGRAMAANRAALPGRAGMRNVRYEVLPLGAADAKLESYRVVVLMPEWTLLLPVLDSHAKAFARYVERGGGLVVFQPNPLCVYPPGSQPPQALAERGIHDEFCTPGVLPLAATFYNRYEQYEAVRNVAGKLHPITTGLSAAEMPYTTDQVFGLDRRFQVLARGDSSDSPSLAVATCGDGRVVLITDNVYGTTAARRAAPTTVIARSLLWASGAADKVVSAAEAIPAAMPSGVVSADPPDEDGEGPARPATGNEDMLTATTEPGAPATTPMDDVPATQAAPAAAPRVRSALAETLATARKGDVVRLQAGVYDVGSLAIPDGVTLAGAGAANTVLKVQCPEAMGAAMEMLGASRLEDVTVLSMPPRRGYMIRASGAEAKPTLTRCLLLPHDNEFCALVAWEKASPTLRNCLIVSPVGGYGVFARQQAAPVLEYCTIVSRGFGVGMMDQATPAIRRSIVVGQCPGILIEAGCEPAVSDCLLWCRGGGGTFPFPITRHSIQAVGSDPDSPGQVKTTVDPVRELTCRRDILVQDPKLCIEGVTNFLRPGDAAVAAGLGAYANAAAWPAPAADAPKIPLPDLRAVLKTPRPATQPK